MDPRHRVVTALPLELLWDESGADLLLAKTESDLPAEAVKRLLREGCQTFVVVEPGRPLVWVRTYANEFWKREVAPHLACWDLRPSTETASDGYFYIADEWSGPDGKVLALTKHH